MNRSLPPDLETSANRHLEATALIGSSYGTAANFSGGGPDPARGH